MLNTKNAMLIIINTVTNVMPCTPKPPWNSCNIPAPPKAKSKFVSGPDTPTKAAPNSSYFTLLGLNGTGLAAKNGGKPATIRTTGNSTVVIGSMCFKGFRVILPSLSAVSSPSQRPVNACIASCKVIDIKIETSTQANINKLTSENIPH